MKRSLVSTRIKKLRRRDILLLVASALALSALGFAVSPGGKKVTESESIGGDGGPMIVLQASATLHWKGAADFEHSQMNGGSIETDYDVICRTQDIGYAIKRHNRDMLILDDSEWDARMCTLPSGAVAVVQQFVGDDSIEAIIERVAQERPTKTFPLIVQDSSLRLLVGADEGTGGTYGYKDVPITPGKKRCDVFSSQDDLVILIKPV